MSKPFTVDAIINLDLDAEGEERIRNQIQAIIKEELSKVQLPKPIPNLEFLQWLTSDAVMVAFKYQMKNIVMDELENAGYYDALDALRDAVADIKVIKETFKNLGGNL